jgi:hypothetical protein
LTFGGSVGVVGTAAVGTSYDDWFSAKSYSSLVWCGAKFLLPGVGGPTDGGCDGDGLAHTYTIRRDIETLVFGRLSNQRRISRQGLGVLQRGNCFIYSHPTHRKKELASVSGWHISERHDDRAGRTEARAVGNLDRLRSCGTGGRPPGFGLSSGWGIVAPMSVLMFTYSSRWRGYCKPCSWAKRGKR